MHKCMGSVMDASGHAARSGRTTERTQAESCADAFVFVCWRRSENSWNGVRTNCVGFQRSGVRYAYVSLSAAKIALMKFPRVFVCPQEHVKQSATPANASIFFVAGAPTTPVPRGAGTRRMRTEPHLPWTFIATVWGRPILLPQ